MTEPAAVPHVPRCPVTGEPAIRRVQVIDARLLTALWRILFRADPRPSFRGVGRFGLWESPTGLYFFDPMLAGDADFYARFYANRGMQGYLRDPDRGEFGLAAAEIRPGDRVLDVGCGFGTFRHRVPDARYTGLDPHFAGDPATNPWARAESLADHLVAHEGTYDVACAFQVMEHVEDPAGLLAEMARAVRPGGKVVVGVPHVPSAPTRVPNWLTNAVPHHLTWWTERALNDLALRSGLVVPKVQASPWARSDVFVYWLDRFGA
ncbi:class I SAM-dependent methyltransferase, partial [Methylobacterium haplocladii]